MISQKLSALPYIADSTGLGLKISNRNFKDFMASIFQGRRQECPLSTPDKAA
ncbi:MAG: hypothetical protein U9N83_18415 [Thermodesulfobacteriota bacterium]|nr:hypothetical protein [Thermodesulfobacteriota bacterium]